MNYVNSSKQKDISGKDKKLFANTQRQESIKGGAGRREGKQKGRKRFGIFTQQWGVGEGNEAEKGHW